MEIWLDVGGRMNVWTIWRKPTHAHSGRNNRRRSCYFLLPATVFWAVLQMCQSQCPASSVTFEKIAGVSMGNVRFVPFYKGFQGEPSVTKECLARCRTTDECQTLLLSYATTSCTYTRSTSDGKRADIAVATPPSSASMFEKICLAVPRCQRLWAFERVIGFEIAGFDDRTIAGVTSRVRCEELCLRERGFFCRSGEFDYSFQQCRLSSEDRRSQPSSFRPAFGDVDYFENQCVPEGSTGCSYEMKDGLEVERIDRAFTTASEAECQEKCDANSHFLCRSFSYRPASALCKLSSDDMYNMGPNAIRRRMGGEYYQKANCLDLKLTCSAEAMELTLRTREPFSGRIYALSQPYCQVYGQKQRVTQFIMPVKGNCGVEEEAEGQLTNTVVIQYHPLIQQKGDRIIKLYCSLFQAGNKTLKKSFRVDTGLEPFATAVVNATAPTPNIRLRITDANGTDVTGARIGDPLYFRIEIDEDSVFGIFARNLTVTNGAGDKQITPIDEDGCPTDPRIFPGFERIPGSKSLQAPFQAFKFPGDPVVKFEVNVHFCLEECAAAICPGGQTSWGRKRRRRNLGDTVIIVPDYPLETAILVEGSDYNDNSTNSFPQNSRYQNIPPDELVCTTKIVLVVSAIGAIFLQLFLLAACGTCLLLSRRERKTPYNEDAASNITETLPPFGSELSRRSMR